MLVPPSEGSRSAAGAWRRPPFWHGAAQRARLHLPQVVRPTARRSTRRADGVGLGAAWLGQFTPVACLVQMACAAGVGLPNSTGGPCTSCQCCSLSPCSFWPTPATDKPCARLPL